MQYPSTVCVHLYGSSQEPGPPDQVVRELGKSLITCLKYISIKPWSIKVGPQRDPEFSPGLVDIQGENPVENEQQYTYMNIVKVKLKVKSVFICVVLTWVIR